MAVTTTKASASLVLKVKTGVKNGQDVIKNLTFKRVKTSVSDQDIYDVAQAIAGLLANPLNGVLRQDVNELING